MKKQCCIILFLVLILMGCSNPYEEKESIETATTKYQTGIATDLEDYIKGKDSGGLITDSDVKVTMVLESEQSSAGDPYGKLEETVEITIVVDDIFDNYSFPEQYDFAYGLFSELQDVYNEKQRDYELFADGIYEKEADYCEAYGISMLFYNYDIVYCICTSENKYCCSNTMGKEYFQINETEYYDSIFKEAYGTATSYDLLDIYDKQEIRDYIQDQIDKGELTSSEIWSRVSKKWGISETEVTIIWAELD